MRAAVRRGPQSENDISLKGDVRIQAVCCRFWPCVQDQFPLFTRSVQPLGPASTLALQSFISESSLAAGTGKSVCENSERTGGMEREISDGDAAAQRSEAHSGGLSSVGWWREGGVCGVQQQTRDTEFPGGGHRIRPSLLGFKAGSAPSEVISANQLKIHFLIQRNKMADENGLFLSLGKERLAVELTWINLLRPSVFLRSAARPGRGHFCLVLLIDSRFRLSFSFLLFFSLLRFFSLN